MRTQILTWLACVSMATSFTSIHAFANDKIKQGSISVENVDKKEYPNLAKIDLQSAVNKALKKYPGKAVEAELEEDNKSLIYEIKIVTEDKRMTEVKIDAGDGKILGFKKEDV